MARRYRRRADLDSPFWWAAVLVTLAWYLLVLAFWVLMGVIWLAWALIAVPIGMIAGLIGKDDLALTMGRSIRWKIPGIGSGH
jgi:hypothetical protein